VGYLGVTVVVAALVVLVTFGSFGQLAKIEVKSVWLLLAGLAVQIGVTFAGIPKHLYDSVGFGLIMFSYVLILTFCFVNIGIRGMGLIAIGVSMNALVIGLNQGMPTRDQPVTTASGRHIRKPIEPDVKHRAERSSDLLPFLSDIIWLPAPFQDEAVSFGDLILAVGICELAYYASRRRHSRGGARPDAAETTAEATDATTDATTGEATDEAPGEPAAEAVVESGDLPAPPEVASEVPVAEASETEASETEASETEASDTEASETEASDTETPEPEASETEASDTEAPEVEAPEVEADAPPAPGGRVALTPTLDQRMGMSAPRRSRTRSNAPSTRPS
jgi:hypothetical protein